MCQLEKTAPPRVEVNRAGLEQAPVLANLLELYAHDFSEFDDLELGADGRFGYAHLPLYWQEPERHPFLITVNDKLCGFVFVHQESRAPDEKDVWDMAEFFVARGFRRHGVGRQAAHQIWSMFRGRWEVRVMNRNVAARQFWERAITEFTGATPRAFSVEAQGKSWDVFSFLSIPSGDSSQITPA